MSDSMIYTNEDPPPPQHTLISVPTEGRRVRTHPRRKAPSPPHNKSPAQPQKDEEPKSKYKKKSSKSSSKDEKHSGRGGGGEKSMSPRTDQYSSLLDEMVGRGDMVLLDSITEDSIMENLKKRYMSGEIYSYIGPVVVSINPYKSMNLYTQEHITEYRSRNFYELPPHIFALADTAYRSMRDHNLDQCIIIAGESGAGKTEASKLVMQYVAAVSGKGEEVDYVKEQLLRSNPVLEAFGNAKTNKNDNSSRFGKYMDIEFDFKGDPVGGIISKYLLEKSRVVLQSPGEKNFHIFYQLLAGGTWDVLQMLHLERDPSCYNYLGYCSSDDSPSASKSFEDTMDAMSVIGFLPEEISTMLELLAAILNLGNIQFSSEDMETCTIMNEDSVNYVCDLLGCSVPLLRECLTMRSLETKMDIIFKPLSLKEAQYARDALAKAIYDRLFTWLVKRINDKIKARTKAKRKVMGVLDIYGFEVFEVNSFEQFIINYCNEKLQQIFIELTLKSEQDEYIREGIEWEHIDYFDNDVICELIEHPNKGILAYIDEECLRPGKPTDITLLQKFDQRCLDHPHYESRASKHLLSDHTLTREQFRLVHYAGKVTYDVLGFMDKNKDLLFKGLSSAMFACERDLLKDLFPEGNLELKSLKRPQTTGYQFRISVGELMKNLLSKAPNYIRCIKPNNRKKPKLFDEPLIRHQVAYLGLLENIRVRRAGFSYRQNYTLALARYKMLCPKTWPTWKGRPKDGIREILKLCCKFKKDYCLGRSKVFIRNPHTVFDLESRRKKHVEKLAILIQKIYRGWYQWRRFHDLKAAQIVISSNFRRYMYRTWFLEIRGATITIQSFYRGMLARRELIVRRYIRDATWASDVIRKYFYGWKTRMEVKELRFHRKYSGPTLVIQSHFRGWRVRRSFLQLKAAVVIQSHYRGWRVRKYTMLERAAVVIQKHFRAMRAREYFVILKAIVTIQSYYRGWKVRIETRKLLKRIAGPKVAKFMWNALCYKFLITVFHNLPTRSLQDKRWPKCSEVFRSTSEKLRMMHHRWRCKMVRDYYIVNPRERRRLSEKSRASSLFKGKKSLYPRTIPIPFKADRLNLRSDERWSTLVAQTHEQRIVWADNVQKLNRKDGKGTAMIMVVTGNSFMLLDTKNLSMKYRVELQHIKHVSMSSFSDQIFVIHIDHTKAAEDPSYAKGDFILKTPNVIEMVTKMHAVIQEILNKKLKIIFSNEIQANFKLGELPCLITFQHDPRAGGHTSSPICRRRGSNMNIVI